jgi:hypothetical protein
MNIFDKKLKKDIDVCIEKATKKNLKDIKAGHSFRFNWLEYEEQEVYKLCI